MKKFCISLALCPTLIWAAIIVPKSGDNIEDISIVSKTSSEIIYTQAGDEKSINLSDVSAILYDDGRYEEIPIFISIEEVKSEDAVPQSEEHEEPIKQKEEKQSPEKQNQTSSENVSDNYFAASGTMGNIKTFEDGSKGVVFYQDAQGHGLVVSLDEAECKWEDVANKRSCFDVVSLPDGANDFMVGQGLINTNAMIQEGGASLYPAAQWCIQHGEGWYLPSAGELIYLLHTANAGEKAEGPISIVLQNAGGMPLAKWFYWASNEEDEKNAYNISASGGTPSEYKCENAPVRAIRQF